jgi:ribosomal protein L16/L10AE
MILLNYYKLNLKKKKKKMQLLLFKKNVFKNQTLSKEGSYYFFSKENVYLNAHQVESLRLFFNRNFKKKCFKVFFNINKPLFITKKPLNFRMGKGKGPTRFVVCKICSGFFLLAFFYQKMINKLFFKVFLHLFGIAARKLGFSVGIRFFSPIFQKNFLKN